MYACKGKRAEIEHQFLIEKFEEEVDNDGSIYRSAESVGEIFNSYRYAKSGQAVSTRNVVGGGSNNRNATLHIRNTRIRPSKALLNCLRNIQEIRERNERSRVAKYSDIDSEGNPLSEGQTLRSERGNGYDGYSMSNNARAAYAEGEQPLSKWGKKEILDAVSEINPDIDFSRLTLETLKDRFLTQSSWHHTSMFYNATGFYSIDEDYNTPCVVLSKPPYVCNVCVRRRKCKADRAC